MHPAFLTVILSLALGDSAASSMPAFDWGWQPKIGMKLSDVDAVLERARVELQRYGPEVNGDLVGQSHPFNPWLSGPTARTKTMTVNGEKEQLVFNRGDFVSTLYLSFNNGVLVSISD